MVTLPLEKLIAIKLTVTTAANPLFYSTLYTEVFCCIQKVKYCMFLQQKKVFNILLCPPPTCKLVRNNVMYKTSNVSPSLDEKKETSHYMMDHKQGVVTA